MRLDKFLKISRLIKRRTVANEACDSSRIFVNGKVAKASYEVKISDTIDILFGNKKVSIRVKDIRETTTKADSIGMYEIIQEDKS